MAMPPQILKACPVMAADSSEASSIAIRTAKSRMKNPAIEPPERALNPLFQGSGAGTNP